MGNVVSMATAGTSVNGRWAPLANVSLCARALERALNRSANLPGIVCFTGPSGYGKSMAASYCANKFEGVYVEVRKHFTVKTLLLATLHEMGVRPARTIGEMMEQVSAQLDLSQRPLILDEGDRLIERNLIEHVRDLHEMSRTTVLIVGEERFPAKLREASERMDNRVLVYQLAQPATADDVRKLAGFYCPALDIADDLLDRVRTMARGIHRRVCVNLDMIRDRCEREALKRIDLAAWGRRDLYTGEAPVRRSA